MARAKLTKIELKNALQILKIKKKRGIETGPTDILAWKEAVTLAPNAYAIHTISNFNSFGKINANKKYLLLNLLKLLLCATIWKELIFLIKTFIPKVSFRRKKWWFPLFAFGKDAAC